MKFTPLDGMTSYLAPDVGTLVFLELITILIEVFLAAVYWRATEKPSFAGIALIVIVGNVVTMFFGLVPLIMNGGFYY